MRNEKGFVWKVRQGERTILYELLPFPNRLEDKEIESSLALFMSILGGFPVDAVNIPEVKEETRNGIRNEMVVEKMEPRVLCSYLQRLGLKNLIVNRPIVYLPWKDQVKWLAETYRSFGVSSLVLVGGESSEVDYPGPSVKKAARMIRQEFPEIFLGGITIPTRQGEEKRVLQKSLAGVEFFTTQILYDAEAIKIFLKAYWELCLGKQEKPKMIFLSFAPVSTSKDLNLLSWLEVEMPKETREFLMTGWLGIGWRSMQVCEKILEEVLEFVEREKIEVPIGLNVEHVSRHNFEGSFVLLERLRKVYGV